MTKTCSVCNQEKPLEGFYKQAGGRFGVGRQCKSCRNAYRRAYGKAHLEKENQNARNWRAANPKRHLNNVLTLKFGITVEQYEKMFKDQNGACAICDKQNLNGRRLAVDHDHSTGKIRGLLCDTCNRGLGYMKDSINLLNKAASYLEGPVGKVLS